MHTRPSRGSAPPRQIRHIQRLAACAAVIALASSASGCTPSGHTTANDAAIGAEPHRPAVHFTPQHNWMNDPNGLVYVDGLYHLYFQHNPSGNDWRNMSWGHATSPDLLHWKEQPIAIAQSVDSTAEATESIYSGSVVIDEHNTSGFGDGRAAPLVAVYTSAYQPAHPSRAGHQAQSLAYSTDGGYTWTKYAGNPVLDRGSQNFRDAKILWYDGPAGAYWVMIAVEAEARIATLYRSDNLRSWEHLSDFALPATGLVECPDLFALPLDDDPAQVMWVLMFSENRHDAGSFAGAVRYLIGDFDGDTFHSPQTEATPLDFGHDLYAATTYSGTDARIMMGWMNNWAYASALPTHPWRGAQSLPRELRLVSTTTGPRLAQFSVAPLTSPSAHTTSVAITAAPISGIERLSITADVARIDVALRPDGASSAGISVFGDGTRETRIGYDTTRRELFVDRRNSSGAQLPAAFATTASAPIALDEDGTIEFSVFLDRSSIEIFTANGLTTITEQVFPSPNAQEISPWSVGGIATLDSLAVTPIAPTMFTDSHG